MLFLIAGILVVCWVLGLIFRVAGGFIHLLLVVAIVAVIISFIAGHMGHP